MAENFENLLDIYQMLRPTSVAAAERVSSQNPTTVSFWKEFFDTLTTVNASGIATLEKINNKFATLISTGKQDLDPPLLEAAKHAVRLYSTNPAEMNWISPKDNPANFYGEDKHITSLQECYTFDSSNKQKFGVIMCCSPMLTPATRNADKVEMWLNYIPSIVLSRCQPYLDIKFESLRGNLDAKKPDAMSLLKFLEGAATLSGVADAALLKGNTQKKKIDGVEVFSSTAGVELFLTPQTLVNTQPQSFDKRYVDATDKFRPFASLQSLELMIQPEIGFITYKNGTLSFILHDRSRLHEISDLIRPQLYHGVTLWITYGWRHPDEPDNPYAKFINNNMLMREAFKIVNIDMSFDEVGQVNIKLKIATSGAKEIEVADATESDHQKALKEFIKIQENIKKLRQVLNLEGIEGVTNEILPYQMLDAVESGTFVKFDEETIRKSIKELHDGIVKKKSASTSNEGTDPLKEQFDKLAADLRENMESYFLDKDKGNGKQTINEHLQATSRKTAENMFRDVIEKPDPFLPNDFKYNSSSGFAIGGNFELLKILKTKKDSNTNAAKNTTQKSPTGSLPLIQSNVVSLGKLLTTFGKNVTKSLNDVSETQFIFYQMNNNCGPMSGMNIAEFPIDYSNFIARYSEFLFNKRSDKITLKEIFALIDATQVKDVRALAYGLSSYYKDFELKNPEPVAKDSKKLTDAIKDRESRYGTFQIPHLQIFVETIHVNNKTNLKTDVDLLRLFKSTDADDDGSQFTKILRIHVYDKTLNPYQAETMLLRPSDTSTHLTEITSTSTEGIYQLQKLINQLNRLEQITTTSDPASIQQLREKIINQLQGNTFNINKNGPPGGALNASDRRAIKDYVARNVPTIIYGANGSTIKTATLSTKSDGLVETANMIKSLTQANTMEVNGSGKFGLPLRVIPAALTMTSAGCPLASPAQMFFIDFNTGTTLDNHYNLTHITHVISKGKFETSWTFGYADGYARFEGAPSILTK